ncbi:hypothetical protein HNP38_002191 [Chryseobacterium defluvii]|uniref:Inner membrane protein n=1 Tax=Chryseobacterium defluvii TaxID=160396 RepID=A0A840KE86_9FLAO|nr:uroporphyrinogen decarboxylase [Chryseobacterium defluvii]MBB4806895.1 hypothetical protein [Chryseobacterium defluvii]
MSPEIATYIGYAASFFIVLSFILKDLRKIRIINLIGCICFVIYGTFSGMLWPVIIPNVLLCFVQIYYLIKGKKDHEEKNY